MTNAINGFDGRASYNTMASGLLNVTRRGSKVLFTIGQNALQICINYFFRVFCDDPTDIGNCQSMIKKRPLTGTNFQQAVDSKTQSCRSQFAPRLRSTP